MKTSRGPGRVTLPRALSKLGLASRSQAIRCIQDGEVTVNKRVELNPHRWIDLERDLIEVKSQAAKHRSFRYVILHKPKGFVTTSADERGQKTVFDVIGVDGEGLSPVGRLDKDSTGLLLFTNDHQLANRLTSPDSELAKTYVACLERPIEQEDMLALSKGMEIRIKGSAHMTKPALVSRTLPLKIEISITEGKNRQIRRMLSSLGYELTSLQRTAVGPLQLGNLEEGQFRHLTSTEVTILKEASRSPKVKAAGPRNRRQ
jgi:23S rRNA pseudouridine2605 synthase